MRHVPFLLLCLLTAPADAVSPRPPLERVVAPTPGSAASAGELSAMLAITADEAGFLQEWRSTPEDQAPTLHTTDQARRGDTLTVLLFFSGCGGVSGVCGAQVEYRVLNPDGSLYAEIPSRPVWGGPPLRPRNVYLSPGMLRIRIEPQDALGDYQVVAQFRDLATGQVLSLHRRFRVSE